MLAPACLSRFLGLAQRPSLSVGHDKPPLSYPRILGSINPSSRAWMAWPYTASQQIRRLNTVTMFPSRSTHNLVTREGCDSRYPSAETTSYLPLRHKPRSPYLASLVLPRPLASSGPEMSRMSRGRRVQVICRTSRPTWATSGGVFHVIGRSQSRACAFLGVCALPLRSRICSDVSSAGTHDPSFLIRTDPIHRVLARVK